MMKRLTFMKPTRRCLGNDLRDGSIDAGLVVLLAVTPRGHTWTQQEIADVCGCARGLIWNIEDRAMKKLKKAYERQLPELQHAAH